jgi:hypothetical protein
MAPLIVATAFFMENLDGTVITTALPQIAESFNIGVVNASSGITSYLITLAIFIPISGWMADRFGSRTVLAWAIGIFTFASFLCALCTGIEQFVVARILQGIGGAMMVPCRPTHSFKNNAKRKVSKNHCVNYLARTRCPYYRTSIGRISNDLFFLAVGLHFKYSTGIAWRDLGL